MRSNWLRIALLTAITSALGCAGLARPAAAGNNNFVYVHTTAGNIHIGRQDERNGTLLPLGVVNVAPFGPASIFDSGTIAYSPRLRLLVIANGNGGAGNGSLSVARVNRNGSLTVLGPPTVVPGSGDLTNLAVVDKGANVFVYVSDPAPNNQIFSFRLGSAGGLTQLGPPIAAGTDPRGITETMNFVFVINELSSDISVFRIQGDGSLTVAGPNVAVTPARLPRLIRSQGNFLYVVDFNPPPLPDPDNKRFFVFNIRSATRIQQTFDSPFTTADRSITSFNTCGKLLIVVGITPETNLQSGVFRKGQPNGRGAVFPVKVPYEIARIDPDCRYMVVARSGTEGEMRSLKIKDSGVIKLLEGGVAPMNTGGAFVNGMVVVDAP